MALSVGESGVPSLPIPKIGTPLYEYLTSCQCVAAPRDTSVEQLVGKSQTFRRQFPVQSVRCSELLTQADITYEQLQHHINSAYPVLHESALSLYVDFLEHKKLNGSAVEKALYCNMGIVDLVQRVLEKRAVVFVDNWDSYLLVDGTEGDGGWESVGKDEERPPLVLANCLSYDEMKLSAFLSVSSHSVFINDGNRQNRGIPMPLIDISRHGVIIGLIGARLERVGCMEWQDIIITKSQNVASNGYGPHNTPELISSQKIANDLKLLWARFYNITPNLPLYEEVAKKVEKRTKPNETRYVMLVGEDGIFDNLVFKRRCSVSIETLLLEAESRAVQENTTAYVYVVGIGLGVWRISVHQEKVFLATFADCVERLEEKLSHVSNIHFGWFKERSCGGIPDGGKFKCGIRINFSQFPPFRRLPIEDEGKLLVVSYAWDGNALPGNEFWQGELSSSGDPAAACSSQITEIHNPLINTAKVCGSNLHVASRQWGVLHIRDYAHRKLAECQSVGQVL